MPKPKRHLYLASASPRRAEILTQFKIAFQVIQNGLETEPTLHAGKRLRNDVKNLALLKAQASLNGHNGLILGVDTVVTVGKIVLGKPRSVSEARQMLTKLSGSTHHVISGLCLYDTVDDRYFLRSELSDVTFRELSPNQIERYCQNFEVLDKAGGYAIQDIGDPFVKTLKGSYFNVVGLPIHSLLRVLKNYDIV